MQWQMHPDEGTILPLPFGVSCACTDSVHLERPYTQLRLLEVFKYEASFLKPVCCVITHTAQAYACTLGTGIGLSY